MVLCNVTGSPFENNLLDEKRGNNYIYTTNNSNYITITLSPVERYKLQGSKTRM